MHLLDRNEKEEKVVELFLENKTVRDIAKIVHMSFRDIGEIIRKYKARKARENLESDSSISEETKAIDFFLKGKHQLK